MKSLAQLLLALLALLAAGSTSAETMKREDVPAPLKTWIPWSLHGAREPVCPALANPSEERICVWPGQLALELQSTAGKFAQTFSIHGESGNSLWIALPGNAQRWPQNVQVNGKTAPVIEREGAPGLYLGRGEYKIVGTFNWQTLPETLTVAARTGMIVLKINGEVQPEPKWDAGGVLTLTRGERDVKTVERIDMRIARLITDDIPLTLTTRLTLAVAGKSREIALDGWLPADAIPSSINSALPARLETGNKLVLQVRPGQWEVTVSARMPGPVKTLTAPKLDDVAEEIWAFAPRPVLRQVTLSGPPQIDPQQAPLPQAWRAFPAYRLKPGEVLSFNETRRGDANPNPDQLAIARNLWLDFDGNGFTVQDNISGALSRSWRLSLGAPYALGRATVGGREQLITSDASKNAGIEVRVGQAQITAESRLEGAARQLPAGGWSFDPQRLAAVLHLPPGWRLFAVSGVDRADGAWVSLWTLLDFFLVLVAAVAAFRLWGIGWGAATLLLLIFTWQEGDAPRWLWLNLIGAVALAQALRTTRLAAWMQRYSALAWLAVVLVAVPFAVTQVRATLYPVLGERGAAGGAAAGGMAFHDRTAVAMREMAPAPASAPAPAPAPEAATATVTDAPAAATVALAKSAGQESREGDASTMLSRSGALSSGVARYKPERKSSGPSQTAQSRLDEIDSKAVVQTGPGLPRWQWNAHSLTWNGPVDKAQTMTLWLLPPWSKMLITIAQLLLLAALLKRTLTLPAWREALPERFSGRSSVPVTLSGGNDGSGGTVASIATMGISTAAVLAACLLAPSHEAHAAAPAKPAAARIAEPATAAADQADSRGQSSSPYPSPELLDELRQRLTPATPACRPHCASIARARVENAGGELRVRLEVQAAAQTAVPLPGGAKQWSPDQVLLNGKPAGAFRDAAEALWLAVPAGVHQIVMLGRFPARDALQLSLPLKPKRVESALAGWRLDGVDADGVPEESLQLSRLAQAGKDAAGRGKSGAEGNLPPFVIIERSLSLGLEWRIRTRVLRTNVAGQPVVIEYPLLPGENVLSPDVKAEGGRARINFGPQMSEAVFDSALAIAPSIKLTAAQQSDWMEVWRLDAGTQWHVELGGIPMIHRQSEGRYLPQWQPWPGETVTIAASKPQAAAGAWLTLDEARAELTPGNRVTEMILTLALRASRGGNHVIDLPEGISLQQAVINGASSPLKIENAKISVPVVPGPQQVVLTLRANQSMDWLYATPAIKLNLPGLNQHVQVNPPRERWILWFSGPRMGPAILLWGVVLVLALIGYALGRARVTPLKSWQWILLLLGLTQASVEGGVIIVGWLVAIALREKMAGRVEGRGWFNATQIGLAALTFVALLMLLGAVQSTLLGLPQMQIEGNGSSPMALRWFLDRGEFPQVQIAWLPLWLWRGVMLLWALWLAWSLIAWLRWGWSAFSAGGLWRKKVEPDTTPPEAAAVEAATAEASAAAAAPATPATTTGAAGAAEMNKPEQEVPK